MLKVKLHIHNQQLDAELAAEDSNAQIMEWNYCFVSLFWIASGEVNFIDFADAFSFSGDCVCG